MPLPRNARPWKAQKMQSTSNALRNFVQNNRKAINFTSRRRCYENRAKVGEKKSRSGMSERGLDIWRHSLLKNREKPHKKKAMKAALL